MSCLEHPRPGKRFNIGGHHFLLRDLISHCKHPQVCWAWAAHPNHHIYHPHARCVLIAANLKHNSDKHPNYPKVPDKEDNDLSSKRISSRVLLEKVMPNGYKFTEPMLSCCGLELSTWCLFYLPKLDYSAIERIFPPTHLHDLESAFQDFDLPVFYLTSFQESPSLNLLRSCYIKRQLFCILYFVFCINIKGVLLV